MKTGIGISRGKEIKEQSDSAKAVILSDVTIFITVCLIFVVLLLHPFFAAHWFAPGDFSYSAAMYYYGIMVPVLILLYLLTKKILPLKVLNKQLYTVSAILSILFVWTSVFGMSLGLAGEILWFIKRWDNVFITAMFIMGIALISCMINLWPTADVKRFQTGGLL